MSESFLNGRVVLHSGDNREVLRGIADCSIDSIVTDPPYALVSIVKRFGKSNLERDPNTLASPIGRQSQNPHGRIARGFMGKQWDNGDTAFAASFWAECLRVLKPGGHVVAFSGTRTYHRMACAIEDAGFEVRDMLSWLYGSGFPKSHDVSKGIDKAAGAEREIVGQGATVKRMIPGADQHKGGWEKNNGREYVPTITAAATESAIEWQGWGTALKPSCEPICFGRKPLSEKTVAANVLEHGTGAINIDGCRIGASQNDDARRVRNNVASIGFGGSDVSFSSGGSDLGRWPANIIHDGSDEVIAAFPDNLSSGTGAIKKATGAGTQANAYGKESRAIGTPNVEYGDNGSAARFFYTAKADADDRLGSKHPTVKPVDLMQWLVRLVTPKGGTVLDPFAGTGTTGEAAFREGMNCILIEREEEYQADIRRRMALCMASPDERARESIKAKTKDLPVDHGPLFGGSELSRGGQTDLRPLRRSGRTIGPTGLKW